MDVIVGLLGKLSTEKLMLLNYGVEEDFSESLARRSNQSILKEIVLNVHWKDWCWSWNANTLATWCKELTHLKRHWFWETLKEGGEVEDKNEMVGWHHQLNRHVIWVNCGSWWWTGRPGVLRFMESQTVGHDWATELNWIEDSLELQALLEGI